MQLTIAFTQKKKVARWIVRTVLDIMPTDERVSGFANLQWSNDPDESVAWMIRVFDAGLTAVRKTPLDG
jgi:hypothetical protein